MSYTGEVEGITAHCLSNGLITAAEFVFTEELQFRTQEILLVSCVVFLFGLVYPFLTVKRKDDIR